MQVLIVSSAFSFEADNIDFSKNLPLDQQADFDVTIVRVQDLAIRICSEPDKTSIKLSDGRDIADFDFVFVKRSASSNYYYAQVCSLYLKQRGVKFINSELETFSNISVNKIVDHLLFSLYEFKIPDTYIVSDYSIGAVESQYSAELKFPMVLKSSIGSKGRDNYLVSNFDEVRNIVNNDPMDYLLQPFIENEYDYRLIVLGYKLKLVIKRTRISNDTHMNNTSQGAKAELVDCEELDPVIKDLAESVAAKLKREIAGVDIMIAKDSSELILLEVNRPPQIETGTFVTEKCRVLADYIREVVAHG